MQTLYDWAGGQPAFERLINAFYDRVEADELLSPFFPGGVHGAHREHVAAWWCEVFGGPPRYTEELGASAVAPHAPVPRWGWGEAPPYVPPS